MSKVKVWVLAMLLVCGALRADHGRDFENPHDENVRTDTPNDPDFDCNEQDDPDQPPAIPRTCSLFASQNHLFGFAPNGSVGSATYKTQARLQDPRRRPQDGTGQVSGMWADRAWKVTLGRTDVVIAILDTGILWDPRLLPNGDPGWALDSVRKRIWLNCAELPAPRPGGVPVPGSAPGCLEPSFAYDVGPTPGGDGSFDVDDYLGDPGVSAADGPDGDSTRLDAQDLIVAFSDGVDDDGNGYVDDISGWDFFEDDNDPSDTTSYSAGAGHGTGRAVDAAEEGNDADAGIGVCPNCRILPLRVWDTFVSPGDTWAAATVYAADNGAHVTETALGVLQNTRTTKAANTYAHSKDVVQVQVSSDLNTANHNVPTNYVESIYINGCIADSETLLGTEFGGSFGEGENEQSAGTSEPVTTWFRNSGVTQYGAHAHVCNNAVTGSQATGLASGAAGMVISRGLEVADAIGGALTANEVKQVLTMTAEDVLLENAGDPANADHAQVGWDEHFGYGRIDLDAAVRSITPGTIPPEALITDPPWWHLLDPGAQAEGRTVMVTGLARASRSTACSYTLEWAVGIQPANDSGWTSIASDSPCPLSPQGLLGQLPLDEIADEIGGHARDGTVPNLNAPARTPDSRPYAIGRPNPNAHMFTVRLVVTDAQDNRGEDRKVYLALHDPTALAGWPKFVDVGGETSPVLYDLDHDGTLEIIDATSGGELCVYNHDGTPLASFHDPANPARFNAAGCWVLETTTYLQGHDAAPGFANGNVPLPTSGFRTPAVADLDGDFEPEIVAVSADGRLFVIRNDGTVRLELGVDPANSSPDDRDAINHPKRGALAAPVLADLDGDGQRDILLAALDGFLYAWDGATGTPKAGFPAEVRLPPGDEHPDLEARGELISTPSVVDFGIDGRDGELQIVTGSGDFISIAQTPPSEPPPVAGGSGAVVAWTLAHAAGGFSRVYALHADGTLVDGWPIELDGVAPAVLPFVGPQHATAAGDLDGDGVDEVVASITTGELNRVEGDGSSQAFTSNGVVNGGSSSESTRIFNMFEYPVIGEIDSLRPGLEVTKLGITANGLANLVAAGQNFKFNHVVQAWNTSPQSLENQLPGFPTAIDDFGLLSTPIIADVNGDGSNDIVAGTGLYLLHAYGPTGTDVAGFPKQTGGWLFSVPAIGDVDGDGDLDLAVGTREGWRFVWDLGAPVADADNAQWWTEGHDECHTNNHRMDCRPPNRVVNLRHDEATTALLLTAPGDDWNQGTVDHFQLRTSASAIATAAQWDSATPLDDVDNSVAAGEEVSIPLDLAQVLGHVAVVPVDEAGNRAKFVNVNVSAPPDILSGLATAGTPVTSSGAPGATVSAGGFTLANNGTAAHAVDSVTLELSDPATFDALRLTGPGGLDVTINDLSATETITFDEALALEVAATAEFTLSATLAAANDPAVAWSGGLNAAHASGGRARVAGNAIAMGLLVLLWLLPSTVLRAGVLALALMLAGCSSDESAPIAPPPAQPGPDQDDGDPDPDPDPPLTSTVKLVGVSAAAGATGVAYQGLPLTLATVTRE